MIRSISGSSSDSVSATPSDRKRKMTSRPVPRFVPGKKKPASDDESDDTTKKTKSKKETDQEQEDGEQEQEQEQEESMKKPPVKKAAAKKQDKDSEDEAEDADKRRKPAPKKQSGADKKKQEDDNGNEEENPEQEESGSKKSDKSKDKGKGKEQDKDKGKEKGQTKDKDKEKERTKDKDKEKEPTKDKGKDKGKDKDDETWKQERLAEADAFMHELRNQDVEDQEEDDQKRAVPYLRDIKVNHYFVVPGSLDIEFGEKDEDGRRQSSVWNRFRINYYADDLPKKLPELPGPAKPLPGCIKLDEASQKHIVTRVDFDAKRGYKMPWGHPGFQNYVVFDVIGRISRDIAPDAKQGGKISVNVQMMYKEDVMTGRISSTWFLSRVFL